MSSSDYVRHFVNIFSTMHLDDPEEASVFLISSFITCYSMMNPEERIRALTNLLDLIHMMGSEVFEDGTDFVSFLKDCTTNIEQANPEHK